VHAGHTGGARGLLGAATAVALAIHARERDRLEGVLVLAGHWQQGAAGPRSRLMQAWDDVGQSELGRLLGLHEPAAAPVATASADHLQLRTLLRLLPFVAGLHTAVGANASGILDLPPGWNGGTDDADVEVNAE
jgi:hypothetical protein